MANKYHIQLKRTRLELNSTETPPDQTLQNYGLVFGEPVYLNTEKTLVIGPPPLLGTTSTKIPDCNGVKLVSNKQIDPDSEDLTNPTLVPMIEQGAYYKNRDQHDVVDLTDNVASKIYPKTKMSAIITDGSYTLDEFLLKKVNIDSASEVIYPSLGYDETDGVYVNEFDPEVEYPDIPDNLATIANKKVSIDDNSAVQAGLALGVDLVGVYVRIPGGDADNINYIKSYIDMMLGDAINTRLLALEGNIYYLQELINNMSYIHVGNEPPSDLNKLWIDTSSILLGGLKYCTNKNDKIWSHVPVAYT